MNTTPKPSATKNSSGELAGLELSVWCELPVGVGECVLVVDVGMMAVVQQQVYQCRYSDRWRWDFSMKRSSKCEFSLLNVAHEMRVC